MRLPHLQVVPDDATGAIWSAGTGLPIDRLGCLSVLFVGPQTTSTGVGGRLLDTAVAEIRGAGLRPVLDVMQTVPPWVYLIPAVMIFSLGRVPAIMATIVYGIPPMLRLTTLAFRQVPADLKELGLATGAPPRAILFKIEIPSAKPTLLVGLNQCILLSLAMVVFVQRALATTLASIRHHLTQGASDD